jgi:hypothetical protein
MKIADTERLEGLVSKRRDRPYQAGRSTHWVKVKNGQHPAMSRVMEMSGCRKFSRSRRCRANSGEHLIALVARPPKPIFTCG